MSRSDERTPPEIGPDIDLDDEDLYLPDGTRLTEAKAAEIAEDAIVHHYRTRGRPSVTGSQERTPSLTVRVPLATRTALERIAATQGRRLADVSRDALAEYAHRHAGSSRR